MAFTGNWTVTEDDRGTIKSASGAAVFSQDNWVVRRFRYSDEDYNPEQGSSALELSGYYGGELAEFLAGTVDGFVFNDDTDWVSTSAVFVDTGLQLNSRAVYVQQTGTFNKPNPFKTNVMYNDGTNWYVRESTVPDIRNLVFQSNNYVKGGTTQLTPNYVRFSTNNGTFKKDATCVEISGVLGRYYCESDKRTFINGLGWYKQEQIWTFTGGWR